jgi:hypothetical protein
MGRRLRLIAILLVGCGAPTAEERQQAAAIRTSKDEPPATCLLYGYSQGEVAISYEAALENLKLQAFRRDANWVVPDSMTKREAQVIVSGRIYKCPDSAFRAPPKAALACVPDCSPGYTCVEGKCISACNPLCEAGQRCGADRICHKAD